MQAELRMQKISNVNIFNLSPGMVTTELLMAGKLVIVEQSDFTAGMHGHGLTKCLCIASAGTVCHFSCAHRPFSSVSRMLRAPMLGSTTLPSLSLNSKADVTDNFPGSLQAQHMYCILCSATGAEAVLLRTCRGRHSVRQVLHQLPGREAGDCGRQTSPPHSQSAPGSQIPCRSAFLVFDSGTWSSVSVPTHAAVHGSNARSLQCLCPFCCPRCPADVALCSTVCDTLALCTCGCQ